MKRSPFTGHREEAHAISHGQGGQASLRLAGPLPLDMESGNPLKLFCPTIPDVSHAEHQVAAGLQVL